MKRGIYLVGNLRSQEMCQNLIYSIRESGCQLPIRLIHFGGTEINSAYILNQVELLRYEDFPADAKQLIANLRTVLTDCPMGYLYRYLAWFSDWDEFIYSDNDIVALCNWEKLFEYLSDNDLVHADEEYTTEGKYNYNKPELVKSIFGSSALETAITAGHIVVKKNSRMVEDINNAVNWFKENPHIPKKHDQSLMHIASLLGNWKMINLCRTHGWLSSWAGDYKNALEIIHKIQNKDTRISHIHYSGGSPRGDFAIQELLFSNKTDKERLKKLFFIGTGSLSGFYQIKKQYVRVKNFAKRNLMKK
ncbi:hypothetical protein [Adhaeribacter aquaticus]|uniref:hypothetical protein n=1 Tax=Adhaeribacter aquaticus TaxID=299567 RepID=UPI000415C6D2|nr:hypothetical protein [Adhaeribacter aquaticus]